jgi:hypothetical protein
MRSLSICLSADATPRMFRRPVHFRGREVGRVQLDAPVQRYLPWWRVATGRVSPASTAGISRLAEEFPPGASKMRAA